MRRSRGGRVTCCYARRPRAIITTMTIARIRTIVPMPMYIALSLLRGMSPNRHVETPPGSGAPLLVTIHLSARRHRAKGRFALSAASWRGSRTRGCGCGRPRRATRGSAWCPRSPRGSSFPAFGGRTTSDITIVVAIVVGLPTVWSVFSCARYVRCAACVTPGYRVPLPDTAPAIVRTKGRLRWRWRVAPAGATSRRRSSASGSWPSRHAGGARPQASRQDPPLRAAAVSRWVGVEELQIPVWVAGGDDGHVRRSLRRLRRDVCVGEGSVRRAARSLGGARGDVRRSAEPPQRGGESPPSRQPTDSR
jgi:hypothetical protein